MILRIDFERFITHMIDHFTREEILAMEFAIVSAGIRNLNKCNNVVKIDAIYPSKEIQDIYNVTHDKDIIRDIYFSELKTTFPLLLSVFVDNTTNNRTIVIIYREIENDYIDLLFEYIKKEFFIEPIDLNKLFIDGRVNEIYIDRDEIYNKGVAIKRHIAKEYYKKIDHTETGRAAILEKMTKKEKIRKLKSYGINIDKLADDKLDELLIDLWVKDD